MTQLIGFPPSFKVDPRQVFSIFLLSEQCANERCTIHPETEPIRGWFDSTVLVLCHPMCIPNLSWEGMNFFSYFSICLLLAFLVLNPSGSLGCLWVALASPFLLPYLFPFPATISCDAHLSVAAAYQINHNQMFVTFHYEVSVLSSTGECDALFPLLYCYCLRCVLFAGRLQGVSEYIIASLLHTLPTAKRQFPAWCYSLFHRAPAGKSTIMLSCVVSMLICLFVCLLAWPLRVLLIIWPFRKHPYTSLRHMVRYFRPAILPLTTLWKL